MTYSDPSSKQLVIYSRQLQNYNSLPIDYSALSFVTLVAGVIGMLGFLLGIGINFVRPQVKYCYKEQPRYSFERKESTLHAICATIGYIAGLAATIIVALEVAQALYANQTLIKYSTDNRISNQRIVTNFTVGITGLLSSILPLIGYFLGSAIAGIEDCNAPKPFTPGYQRRIPTTGYVPGRRATDFASNPATTVEGPGARSGVELQPT